MTDYTYLFVDILSNRVVHELPCYGTWFQRTLSGTGNMTATVPLNAAGFRNIDTKSATTPGKTALYAIRNDVVIWGGPIWTRTYNRSAKAISLTGQTWESWPYRFYPPQSLLYSGIEQRNIAIDLLTRMQAEPLQNAQFTLPANYPMQVSRTENFPVDDLKSYGELIEYLTEYDTGFDFEILPQFDTNGVLQRYVKFGNPLLGVTEEQSGLLYEYEGSITDYYYSENASGGVVKAWGVGAGDSPSTLRSSYTHSDIVATGNFPLLQGVFTNKDITSQFTLDAQTKLYAQSKRTPIVGWTIDVDPSMQPVVGTWSLGDQAHIQIEDEAFFTDRPFDGFVRVIGWELNPSSDTTEETLKLLIEEEETADG